MRSRRFDFAVTVACLALLAYLGWHGSRGPRGYAFHDRLVAEAAVLTDRLSAVEAERDALERRVALLRPESLDPDLLDELARSELEVVAPGDLVVLDSEQFPKGNP